MSFFDIDSVFFEILGYEMSYLEFFGTIAGALAVWLSAKANIWSWPIGIVNVVLFFFLFYQVQLYPDMFLQIFFFITNLLGWWRWANPKPGEENRKNELRASFLGMKKFILACCVGLTGTYLFGTFAKNLHALFPAVFSIPSAFPYADSFVTVMSIVTTFLMIQKKIECWVMWILVDGLATYLYFVKGIKFVSIEYLAFCFIAAYGLWNWTREHKLNRRPIMS
ncbi:MAG: nicotinamide riboside transporter PnuC [Anaerolineales bacterium]|nr:nicotinamide riboside transporter PnuC [Anaerolineales bacterium]